LALGDDHQRTANNHTNSGSDVTLE
jgi:hypothetical protein